MQKIKEGGYDHGRKKAKAYSGKEDGRQSWHLTRHREMKARVPEEFMIKGDFWFCKVRNYIKTNLIKRK